MLSRLSHAEVRNTETDIRTILFTVWYVCSFKLSASERSLPVVPSVPPATLVVEECVVLFVVLDYLQLCY